MNKLIIITIAALTLVFSPTAIAQEAGGDFLIQCAFTSASNDDPIVFPSQPNLSHRHDFFGGKPINAFSTYPSLSTSSSTCQDGKDFSGYWIPAILKSGMPIEPQVMAIYYRSLGRRNIQPFPQGLRHVQGNAANTNANNYTATYMCGPNGSQHALIPWAVGSDPSCPAGSEWLQVDVYFPACWNGLELDNAQHKTLINCGPGTVPVPAIQVIAVYPISAVGGRLSSDHPQAYPGVSGHADFFNAWEPLRLQELITRCLNTGKSCRPQDGQWMDVSVSPPLPVGLPL